MRASGGFQHLSGAERLVSEAEIEKTVSELNRRALRAAAGTDVEIHLSVEKIKSSAVQFKTLPDLLPYQVESYQEGRALAQTLLELAGVPKQMATDGLKILADGPGPGGRVMRGAVVLDVQTGQRMESDPARGIRATRMDLTAECRDALEVHLQQAGLSHRRVIEALALSGKVLNAPGFVAELCWSDDPEYVAGYVASPLQGYQRISALKSKGDPIGGRIFFMDSSAAEVAEMTGYVENQPVLFNRPGTVLPWVKWKPDNE